MGSGAAPVSTPYWYAKELLAEGRGHLLQSRKARQGLHRQSPAAPRQVGNQLTRGAQAQEPNAAITGTRARALQKQSDVENPTLNPWPLHLRRQQQLLMRIDRFQLRQQCLAVVKGRCRSAAAEPNQTGAIGGQFQIANTCPAKAEPGL